MNQLPTWQIGKDNQVRGSPFELRRLRRKVHLTDRTLHVECPQYPVMDAHIARAIAVLALSDAVIGRCGKILVKGPRWRYEFDTKGLNNFILARCGGRMGLVQNPIERQQAGSFYDTMRGLWQVPVSYGVRERKTFPMKDGNKDNSSAQRGV